MKEYELHFNLIRSGAYCSIKVSSDCDPENAYTAGEDIFNDLFQGKDTSYSYMKLVD